MDPLLSISPRHFEEFVAEFLRARGYSEVQRIGRAGDLGVDIRCRDRDGRQVVVQCKRYRPSRKIGSPAIQTFVGMAAHHGAERGIFVTTSDYTVPAQRLAAQQGIELIDGSPLIEFFPEFEPHRVEEASASQPKAAPTPAARPYEFVGGRLCLDFVNTAVNWHAPRRTETGAGDTDHLAGYPGLLDWACQADAVSGRIADRLRELAGHRPEEAEHVFQRAVSMRTALHDTFVAAAQGRPPADGDLVILDGEIGALLAASRLEPAGAAYALARPGERDDDPAAPPLDRLLWPVVRSAIALFTSAEDLARVRACPGADCGWLFYDASGRRRWCSMAACGTRDKVRRFRARQRDAAASA